VGWGGDINTHRNEHSTASSAALHTAPSATSHVHLVFRSLVMRWEGLVSQHPDQNADTSDMLRMLQANRHDSQ
jgi:hypothetical protein